MTRVAVVGPGAIGAAVAAMARRAGSELILCGRTPLEHLVVSGLGNPPQAGDEPGRVVAGDPPDDVVPGPVLTDPAAVPWHADVVLLAVKAHQTAAAAGFLRALASGRTVVVVLQNGVEQRALVEPYGAGATVLPAVVWMATETTAPGHVRVVTPPRFVLPPNLPPRGWPSCCTASRPPMTSPRRPGTSSWSTRWRA